MISSLSTEASIKKNYYSYFFYPDSAHEGDTSFEAALNGRHANNIQLSLSSLKSIDSLAISDESEGLDYVKTNMQTPFGYTTMLLKLSLEINQVHAGPDGASLLIKKDYLLTLNGENILFCLPNVPITEIYNAILNSLTLEDLRNNLATALERHLYCLLPKRAPDFLIFKINGLNSWLKELRKQQKLQPDQALNVQLKYLADELTDIKTKLAFYLENTALRIKQVKAFETFFNNIRNIEKTITYKLKAWNDERLLFSVQNIVLEKNWIKFEEKLPELTFPTPTSFQSHLASFLVEQEKVDLQVFPIQKPTLYTPGDSVAIGDMHGNFIKQLYFLYYENIIASLTQEAYSALYMLSIMSASDLQAWHLDIFIQNLSQITKPTFTLPAVTFMGDLMADRRTNVLFVLFVLRRMAELQVPKEILISNHDNELIGVYENGDLFEPETVPGRMSYSTNIDCDTSLQALGTLLKREIIKPALLRSLIEEHYLPHLIAMKYSINYAAKEFIFFTHAPVGLNIIKAIAAEQKLNIDETMPLQPEILGKNIQIINAHVSQLFRNRQFYQSAPPGSALYALLWHRIELGKPETDKRLLDSIPGWRIQYVHGHDGQGISQDLGPDKIDINLDNILGKFDLENNKEILAKYMIHYVGNNESFPQSRSPATLRRSTSQTGSSSPSVSPTSVTSLTSVSTTMFAKSLREAGNLDRSRSTPGETEVQLEEMTYGPGP